MNPRLAGPFAALQKVKYVRTVFTVVWFLVKLASCLRHYDILHVFSAAYFSFWWAPMPAILLAKLCGKKVILNYRDGQAEDHLRNWRSAIPVIRKADVTVAPSDPAGVASIGQVRLTPDGKSCVYSFKRTLSELYLVEGQS